MNHISIYAHFLENFLKADSKIRVIFDCSDGTTGLVLKKLFTGGSKDLIFLNAKPNGNFPAHGPNPWVGSTLKKLGKKVVKGKFDLGAVFDGDGDRVFFVDNRGREISGDATAALLASFSRGPVILDVRAGYAAHEYFQNAGRKVVESRIGHFFIKKLMREQKITFGAEVSGHYYFAVSDAGKMLYFDSGILAAIHMINQISSIKSKKLMLSDWIDALPQTYRVPETNFEVRDKKEMMKKIETHFKKSAWRISKLDGLRMEFHSPDFWFSVRPSNTEDLLRLNLEARSKGVFREKSLELRHLIRR